VITTKIKAEFAKDKTVSATSIKVETEDKGVVTLSGNAKSKAEIDQAVKLARDTNGVISVKNNIMLGENKSMTSSVKESVSSAAASVKENAADSVITTKIKAEFAKDKTVSAMHVKVETDDKGAVTLSGTAKSKAEADQAVKLAKETKGVSSVKNDIMVTAPVAGYADKSDKSMTQSVKENVGDAVITTKIKAEFAKDKMVSAMNVKVDTDDKGAVTLSGTAKSKAESDQAVKLAKETKGVTSVKNDITIQAK
jgi:hyperosmotically inducible protein